jgi:hypothetical protein
MKYLLMIAIVAACSLGSSAGAQELQIQTGGQEYRFATPSTFTNYHTDSYGRRLNRYQRNYGYNNYRNRSNWSRQYGNGYRNYDYYGRNYGRVRDYRGVYQTYPNRGYYNGYYMRPGFTIGGGSSRVFFGF